MPVQCTCSVCGKVFPQKPSRVAAGKGKFCSKPCTDLDKQGRQRQPHWRRTGPKATPPSERMHRFVIKHEDECWGWNGATSSGYGVIGDGVQPNHFVYAHRVAWEMASGAPIPDKHGVYHTCDNRPCTRNDEQGTYEVDGILYPRWGHLFCAPQLANVRDMHQKGRARYGHFIGVEHPRAVLTEEDVRTIRALASNGANQADLAHQYGVTKEAIYAVVKRRTWSHIP